MASPGSAGIGFLGPVPLFTPWTWRNLATGPQSWTWISMRGAVYEVAARILESQ